MLCIVRIIYSEFMKQLATVFECRERRYVLGYAIGTEVCLFFNFAILLNYCFFEVLGSTERQVQLPKFATLHILTNIL